MDKYHIMLQKLNNVAVFRKDRATLNNMYAITKLLGNPQNKMKFIHVAGTNGKGSVTLKMWKLMAQIGKCGCFTSPHITSFRERIKIDDQMIPQHYVVDNLDYLFTIAEKNHLQLTFFEYVTALALKFYGDMGVEFVAWETGLGGRMDSTNIIQTPLISIITTIGMDHMHILGNSIEQIAKEKAGIIKENCPVVLGPNCQPQQIFIDEAKQKGSQIHLVQGQYETFNEENNAIVKLSSNVLEQNYGELDNLFIDFKFNDLTSFLEVQQPCRLELVKIQNLKGQQVNVFLDVGHNEQAIARVLNQLKNCKITCIYGASKDKDIQSCMTLLLNHCEKVYMIEAKNKRAFKVSELQFNKAKIIHNGDIIETTREVVNNVDEQDRVVLVLGSFYIISDVRKALDIKEDLNICDFQF